MRHALLVAVLAVGSAAHAATFRVDLAGVPPAAHPGNRFAVQASVVNTTSARVTIETMSCSWPLEWRASGADLELVDRANCDKNVPQSIELAPGGRYSRTLTFEVAAAARPGPHALQVGYAPDGATPLWSAPQAIAIEPADHALIAAVVAVPTRVRRGAAFSVDIAIANTTELAEVVSVTGKEVKSPSGGVLGCGLQWPTDDAGVTAQRCPVIGLEASFALAPGESHAVHVAMVAARGATPGRHLVRFGFVPDGWTATIWSAPVAIELAP